MPARCVLKRRRRDQDACLAHRGLPTALPLVQLGGNTYPVCSIVCSTRNNGFPAPNWRGDWPLHNHFPRAKLARQLAVRSTSAARHLKVHDLFRQGGQHAPGRTSWRMASTSP